MSPTEPRFEPMARPAPPTENAAPVASQGDCAPRYATGLVGSCINSRPCRGFGVFGADGQPVCACYATPGGCGQGERCDAIKKACVSEREPGWGRARDD